MGARIVGDGDRFKWDEQRKDGSQASDAKWWELQSRDGSRLRREDDIGHSTACGSDHWPTDGLQDEGQAHPFGLEPTIIRSSQETFKRSRCIRV